MTHFASRPAFRRGGTVLLASLAVLVATGPSAAQDAHYWSQQYGTRSELLGGTVVGSPQDLSTTYYNPGGLAFLGNQSFLLSALAMQYESYGFGRPSGAASDLAGSRFGPAPILVTGTLPRNWVDGTLAYSYLTRQKLEVRINSWQPSGSDPDAAVGNLLFDARVSESWGGLTWSNAFGDLGVGASIYGAYRSQRSREEVLFGAGPTPATSPAVATVNDYRYWHVRTLAKLGIHWDRDAVSLGLTYTTPGLPLFGSGEASYYRRLEGGSGGPGIDEAGVETEPGINYRSPMSLAVGSRIDAGASAFYVTAEWYDSVDPYRVVSAEDFPEEGPGSSLQALLRQQLKSVLNVGMGAEFSPRDDLTLVGSLTTDYSAANGDPGTAHSFAIWDIYQATAGAAFTLLQADLTLGVSFGGGGDTLEQSSDFAAAAPIPGGDVSYRRWKVFLGFEYGGAEPPEP